MFSTIKFFLLIFAFFYKNAFFGELSFATEGLFCQVSVQLCILCVVSGHIFFVHLCGFFSGYIYFNMSNKKSPYHTISLHYDCLLVELFSDLLSLNYHVIDY